MLRNNPNIKNPKESLSIIVPCYNEELNVPILLEKFDQILKNNSNIELIIVDNGSTDNTSNIIDIESKKYKYNLKKVTVKKNLGYGYGLKAGLEAALGDTLSWTHGDLQTDPMDVINAYELFLKKSKTNPKVIIKGNRNRIKTNPLQAIYAMGLSFLSLASLKKYISDINGPPKLFPRAFYDLMKEIPSNFSIDLYMIYLALKHNYQIVNIPVEFKKRLLGTPKGAGGYNLVRIMKIIFEHAKYIYKLWQRSQ